MMCEAIMEGWPGWAPDPGQEPRKCEALKWRHSGGPESADVRRAMNPSRRRGERAPRVNADQGLVLL